MKHSSLTIAAAFAVVSLVSPATVSAAPCTNNEIRLLNGMNLDPLREACPSIFVDEIGSSVKDMNTITADALKAISPCQASLCLSSLSMRVSATPDCVDGGTNYYKIFSAYQQLCQAFGTDEVTVSQAQVMFQGAGSWGAGGAAPTAKQTTTTMKPTSTPTSNAGATTIAGVMLAMITTLVANLVL